MAKEAPENMLPCNRGSTVSLCLNLQSSVSNRLFSRRMRYDLGTVVCTNSRDKSQGRFFTSLLSHNQIFSIFYNTQKQGVLPLWFVDKGDYTRIGSGDTLETIGLADVFAGNPNASIRIKVTKPDNSNFEVATTHTLSVDQLKWLRVGSALNYIRSKKA